MVAIFTKTSSTLSLDFISKFSSEKLALSLMKIGQETGVEFSRQKTTYAIAGQWNEMIRAHRSLEVLFENEDFQDINFPDRSAGSLRLKAKKPVHTDESSKPGRKPGNSVKTTFESSVPAPVVLYEHREHTFLSQDLLKPKNLLNALDTPTSTSKGNLQNKDDRNDEIDNTSNSKGIDEERSRAQDGKNQIQTDEKDRDTNERNEDLSEVKVEVFDDADMQASYDDDTDIDEGYLNIEEKSDPQLKNDVVEKNHNNRKQSKEQSNNLSIKMEKAEELSCNNRKKSRRKSKPVKYVSSEKEDDQIPSSDVKQTPAKKGKGRPTKNSKEVSGNIQKVKRKRKKKEDNPVEEPTEFHCDSCSYVGSKKANLKEHIKRKHRNKYTCDVCQKQFGFNKDLNRHKRQVHSEPSHFCEVCNKFYKSKRVYDEHVLTHQENYVKPNFACKLCKKSFSTKYVLAAHIKAEHLGMKKTYMCPTCGRSFTQKNSYVMHANVHAGIKPYVCDVCGKAFTYDKSLKEHKFMHDNIRRFQCHICSKTFRQTTSLRIHMKVHKESKDYMCTSCGKGFTQKQALLRHERIHSGDKPFVCGLCGRSFSDYSIIRRHMLLIHKKDPKDWRGDIISNLKRKKDYYIDGGPGHHVRELRSSDDFKPSETGANTSDLVHVANSDLKTNVDSARTGEDNSGNQTSVGGPSDQRHMNRSGLDQNVIQDLSQSTGSNTILLSQPVFPMSSSYSQQDPSHIHLHHSHAPSTEEKSPAVEQNSSSVIPMPINYSIPGSYSSSPPTSTVNDENPSSRYQSIVDSYRAQGQHRDIPSLYGPNPPSLTSMPGLSDQVRSQIGLVPGAPVSTDTTTQSQHLPWGYHGYPAYYSHANFSQYQGPQS